ncbi:MAG: NUDIX domain-containing protein, partial [Pseudomonadota bacterium]
MRPDGQFLLTRRPDGKIYSGYWEFPGGKVEKNESLLHALDRELQEELGIQIRRADPWVTRVFTYAHATVRLHFFRVVEWEGRLIPRENQGLSWQWPHQVEVSPVLPANGPVLQALLLPPVYAITRATE